MCKVLSQGLIMSPHDFGWEVTHGKPVLFSSWTKSASRKDFVTELLGITYATSEDNKRKAPSTDKYKKMAQRKPHIFKQPWARWMMRREWGKKVMFVFFGKRKIRREHGLLG